MRVNIVIPCLKKNLAFLLEFIDAFVFTPEIIQFLFKKETKIYL